MKAYFVTPTQTRKYDDEAILWREYDFKRGDDRKINKSEALILARERARVTQRVQQVIRIEGPLVGEKMWLIQSTRKPLIVHE